MTTSTYRIKTYSKAFKSLAKTDDLKEFAILDIYHHMETVDGIEYIVMIYTCNLNYSQYHLLKEKLENQEFLNHWEISTL